MSSTATITLPKLFTIFLKFGFLAWGGPVAQIAMLKEELVSKKGWISTEKFNRVLAVYQALPGPEAHEMCCYFGHTQRGRIGSIVAGLGFMLPGFVLMLLLSWAYLKIGPSSSHLVAAFSFMQPAVTALVVRATHKIALHLIKSLAHFGIFLNAVLCSILEIDFWIPLLSGALVGGLSKQRPRSSLLVLVLIATVALVVRHNVPAIEILVIGNNQVVTTTLPLWLATLCSGLKAGLLTFGGAYTAIPFIQHDAVVINQWLSNSTFIDGIALAGIIPAPLVIFSSFVGFMAAGWIGALSMTLGIFLPAFSFTLFGHTLLEKLVNNKKVHGVLDGLAAAVVGVMAFTAAKLFSLNCLSVSGILIFSLALAVLYLLKKTYTVPVLMLIAGAMGLMSGLAH